MSNRYRRGFNNTLLFGSLEINPAVELEIYFEIKSKKDLKNFNTPIDLLKIGALDLWIGNMDRKPKNPNIIMSGQENGFELHPIDHTAIFGYLTNYREVRSALLRVDPQNSILSSELAKKINNFTSQEAKLLLKNGIIENIENTGQQLDFIFDQVPTDWGFGRNSKSHLKDFFTNEQYNQETIQRFLSF